MTLNEAKQRLEFERVICEESALPWSEAKHRAALLCRHGKTYARIQEANCNGVDTFYGESTASFAKRQERFEKALEHKESLIERRIKAICAELGFPEPVLNGDPRGATVKIVLPSGKANDWGKEGYCVPTS